MCGRFTITVSSDEIQEYIDDRYNISNLEIGIDIPNYNVAPGTDIISVIHDGKKHRIGLLRWGYIPSFSKDLKINLINARSETIFEKPSFKKEILSQRCIVLADGFYEWKKGIDKQPMRITTEDKLFSMAGIWNSYINKEGKKIYSVAIVTTEANDQMKEIHDRMPVILSKDDEAFWLNRYIQDQNNLQSLFKPYKGKLIIYPVSKQVNSTFYNKVEAIANI